MNSYFLDIALQKIIILAKTSTTIECMELDSTLGYTGLNLK